MRKRRREFLVALLLCAAGAGVALVAATRTWSLEVISRPAPLPDRHVPHTGGALLPWLPAAATVGLAGTGAIVATRGILRRIVGILLVLVGLALGAAGGYGLVGVDRGAAGAAAAIWPGLVAVGGLLLAAGAAATALRGERWPAMGARYERTAARRDPPRRTQQAVTDDPRSVWDALDRGDDPTLG